MNHCCNEIIYFINEESLPFVFKEKFREYGILYLDGGSSMQEVRFCPWCGTKLPSSLRDRWFEEIEKLGYDANDSEIPDQYKNGEWWKK